MKLLIATCFVALAFLSVAGSVRAEVIAQYTAATAQHLYVNKDITTAQAFDVSVNTSATEVQLQMSRWSGTAGKVIMELRSETDGHPSAGYLAHEEVNYDNVPMGTGAWMSFKLSSAVPLTGGLRYWIVIKVTTGSDIEVDWYSRPWSDPPQISYGAGDDVKSSTDGGATWTIIQGQDTNFKVFGTRAALATNTTVTLSPASIATFGQTTVTVTVRDSGNNLVQGSGTVTLSVTKGTLGSSALTLVNGQATTTWTVTASTVGNSITASYAGHSFNGNDYSASQKTAALTVFTQQFTSSTTIGLNPANAMAHAPVTVSVSVKDNNNQPMGGGSVAFSCPQGGTFASASVAVVNGAASTTWDPPYTETTCSITAAFSGYNPPGKQYGQSSATQNTTVTFPVVPTTTTIRISPDYAYISGKAWATIEVKDNLGNYVPGGTVSLITDWGWFDSTSVPLVNGKGTMVWNAPASAQTAHPAATYQQAGAYKSGGYAYATSSSGCTEYSAKDPDNSGLSLLTEWNTDYATSPLRNTGKDAQGFRDRLNAVGWNITQEFSNDQAWQDDFKLSSKGGDEDNYADANDYIYYSGHGSPHFITFINNNDDTKLYDDQAYHAWGDKDTEWVSFSACLELSNPGEWANTMNGVHLECGYHTTMADSARFGGIYGDYLTQTSADDYPIQVCSAWFLTADKCLSIKHRQVVIGESADVFNDYIWGQGYVYPDPAVDDTYYYVSHDSASTVPVANAGGGATKTYNATADTWFQLDGSGSSDADPTETIWYAWDLDINTSTDKDDWDLDGTNDKDDDADTWGVRPSVKFHNVGNHTVRLMVIDEANNVSTDTATVVVAAAPGPAPKYSNPSSQPDPPEGPEIVDRFGQLPNANALPSFRVTGGPIGFTQMASIVNYWGMHGSAFLGDNNTWTMNDGVRQLEVNRDTGATLYMNRAEAYRWTHTPTTLPNDYYCQMLADSFLNANGISTADAILEGITSISQSTGTKGVFKYDTRVPFQKRVNYRRLFSTGQNMYPAVGPGGKMIVLVDDTSDVQLFLRTWRPAEMISGGPLYPAAAAITDFHRLGARTLIGYSRIPECSRINIDNVTLGYYEDDFVTPQMTILPVYALDVTCENEYGTFGTQVYLPAYTAPMEVGITAPTDGAEVSYGTSVAFTGNVVGGKPPYSYAWSSDKDGALGAGPSITTSALSVNRRDVQPTTHTITLTVTDADGWQAGSQIQLKVTPQSVSGVKTLANGNPVALLGDVVTVSQPTYFYVENTPRNTGIKVVSNLYPDVSSAVAVYGTAGTDHNERCVNATSAQVVKPADPIKPYAANSRWIGGGTFGAPPLGQWGVIGGNGLNTIGLLMRTAGKVTARFPAESPQRFTIDDGWPNKINCLCLPGVALPTQDAFCTVTGVSSLGFAPTWDKSATIIVTEWK